jgi:hypothetical protein
LRPTRHGFASAVERRLGAAAAGWVAALPVAFAITVIGVGVDAGAGAVALLALSAAGHVAAQIGFAVCAVAAIRRRDLGRGLMAGALGYAAMSVLLEGLPAVLAAAAAIPALLAGPRLVASRHPSSRPKVAQRGRARRCCAWSRRRSWPARWSPAGSPGPAPPARSRRSPVMSATLAISLGRSEGRLAAAWALQGLVRSLPCYLTFCLVVATTAPSLPLPWSIALALTASVTTGRLTWKRVPVAVTS